MERRRRRSPIDRSKIDVQVLDLPSPGSISDEAFDSEACSPTPFELGIVEWRNKASHEGRGSKAKVVVKEEQRVGARNGYLAVREACGAIYPNTIRFEAGTAAKRSEPVQPGSDVVGAQKAAVTPRAVDRVIAKPATRGAFLARPLNVGFDARKPVRRYSPVWMPPITPLTFDLVELAAP